MVPPLIRPAATSTAPSQMISVIAPSIMEITIAVINERSRMRRLAVEKTRSTAPAKRDRHCGADDLLDDRGVDGDARRDLGRTVFLEETGRQAQQIAMHGETDIGDCALAEPRDVVVADGGRDRQYADEKQEIFEPA